LDCQTDGVISDTGAGGALPQQTKIDLSSGGQFCYKYRSKLDEDCE